MRPPVTKSTSPGNEVNEIQPVRNRYLQTKSFSLATTYQRAGTLQTEFDRPNKASSPA